MKTQNIQRMYFYMTSTNGFFNKLVLTNIISQIILITSLMHFFIIT